MNSLSILPRLSVVVLAATLLASCDFLAFDDMNENPTQATAINPDYLLSGLEAAGAGTRYETWRGNLIYSSSAVQHFTSTWWSGDKGTLNLDWSTALWDVFYTGRGETWRAQARNLQDLLARTADRPEDVNRHAIARIWKVFLVHRVTDMYGDMPYFDAGMGFLNGVYQPAYDRQEEIYPDLLKELDEAVASFDPAQPTPGAADFIYGGDIDQWKTFGRSLMLRLGMRLSRVNPALAQQWVQKAVAGGVMQSNDDNAMMQHTSGPDTGAGGGGVNTNPNSDVWAVDAAWLTEAFVNWMVATGDPRLAIYGDPSHPPKGFPAGYDGTTVKEHPSWSGSLDDYTLVNEAVVGQLDDPTFFQTYAEVALLQAEAAARGWISGNPATFYADGVRAAMQNLALYDASAATIPDAEIDAYLARNPYNAAAALEQINTQLWAALFLNGYEAWANYRRSGYPVLTTVNYPGNVSDGKVPRKMVYPSSEAARNPDHFAEVLQRQGPNNTFTTRVWWDPQ